MNLRNLSNKIEGGGCIITAENDQKIIDLDRNSIIRTYRDKGVILFRGFKNIKSDISTFTDQYTKKYANDAMRRENRFGNKKLNNVDPGNMEMPMHSEASYSPSWPEIVWFFCNVAPKKSGKTTLSDGVSIFKKFNSDTKNFFLKNQILYDCVIPFSKNKKIYKKKNLKPWYIETPGIFDCYIDFNNKDVYLKLKRYAVQIIKSKEKDLIAFSNHLQIILERDPQLKSIKLENGKKLSSKIMNSVKKATDYSTIDIDWKDGDLIMINNRRFMHGRRKISTNEKRDIINIQTLRASFN